MILRKFGRANQGCLLCISKCTTCPRLFCLLQLTSVHLCPLKHVQIINQLLTHSHSLSSRSTATAAPASCASGLSPSPSQTQNLSQKSHVNNVTALTLQVRDPERRMRRIVDEGGRFFSKVNSLARIQLGSLTFTLSLQDLSHPL